MHKKISYMAQLVVLCSVWMCISFASICLAQDRTVSDQHLDNSGILTQTCQLIYQGKFDEADQIIKNLKSAEQPELAELAKIIQQYEQLSQEREEKRQKLFQERWDKLDKLYLELTEDINDANHPVPEPNDINDINDVNDANQTGSSAVLSVATTLMEIADEEQKQKVLSHPAVQKAIELAKQKAADYEAQGKWLDAYTSCYYWLNLLYEHNEQYKEHTEELIEKANIVAAFQDSPCESRAERYANIEKEMFEKAIDVIHSQYVNPRYLDYSKMALKALRRAQLLAEVVRVSFDEIHQSKNNKSSQPAIGEGLYRPDCNSVAAWTAALEAIKEDIESAPASISKDKFIDIFEKVLLLNTTTVALPEEVLIAHFAEASLSVLDPHTVIVWPQQVEDFRKNLMGEFAGIGVLISKEKGLLTATSLLPDTPAYRSGLDAGDIIEAIDGVPTKDMPLTCAVKLITGPAGTPVRLTVRTPGQQKSREIVITRAKITVGTIYGWQRTETGQWRYMIDENDKIAYVRITSFSEKTADDFEKVLKELEKQGLRGLILDLRFNQGGLLESAVKVVDKFIREGLIVRTQPRWGIATYLTAKASGTHPNYPLVVLVNGSSASASEIVAGALQDPKYKRAIIIGERTYGKGSVQAITYRPGGGAQLKYTMAYYHLPSGQRVKSREEMEKLGRDDWGITPDIEVKLTVDELKQMTEVQRDNDVLAKADHDVNAVPLKKHSIEETLASDPQLNVGLLVIKTKLLEQNWLAAKAG